MNRTITLGLILTMMGGCASGPEALGITGPGGSEGLSVPSPEQVLERTGPFQSGGRYAPSMVPSTGNGRYWGYD
ncbi:MAG: hypothetical protein JO227_01585 [Acetobacteraceae bacterium]|nr:hypothetical protein [Acetobacteraceae bacterium]